MRLAIVLLLVLPVLGCGVDADNGPESPLVVAASIPPHAWLIEEIGGDLVESYPVLGPGDSPATFQPADAQVSRLLICRAFFRAGLPYESGSWFGASSRHLDVVDLREGVPMRSIGDGEAAGHLEPLDHHHAGAPDPHSWLSPKRLLIQARHIGRKLTELDPSHADLFAERLAVLAGSLEELDARIALELAPHRGRTFVVFHPSWGYFADDYGLRQIAIEVDGKDPSDTELTRFQESTRDLGITVVFVQPQISGRSARAVAAAIGARIETLDPLAPNVLANLQVTADKIADSLHE